ncbi:MAG: hypothetical protein ACRERU_21890 [Methylococcales bacterium]
MTILTSGLPEHVADQEDLARFLTQRNYFNSTMVKPAAFLPNPKDRETSVSRHGKNPVERLWEIGLIAAGSRSLYGAAIFKARAVRGTQLDVFVNEPPIFHAAIRGWPWVESDPELQKAKQKELAVRIAVVAGPPFLR